MEQNEHIKDKSISILGCGWLGLPLAGLFVQQGYRVKGSVTSEEKLEALFEKGILPYQLTISDQEINCSDLQGFLESEILVINFPPSRRPDIPSPSSIGQGIRSPKDEPLPPG